ncbi:hypothetical protein M409DRAFT_24299 [Zasmidium cellare ATCC 36951]|uniref:Methyltransferase domain-containing protein n=1 Tax=Zasmidium cellare ATCC 36951 TaxID=1080233 RepID=A0A6A6CGZ0_ZASCE|nr:uncharacterized protein M409DRAFT_24299 [Zasmidium cellare ATCC 36951]KAF2165450.1 hypothetical protein M409DRAFT_24299 [Zasmidium cellare ATCC 36951]
MSKTTHENQQTADRNAYPLNRDVLASARLHLQHQVWISSLHYLLHPSIPLSPQPPKTQQPQPNPLQIAEIGSGTGLFTLQLASHLSTQNVQAEIYAYDLSLSQSPPQPWWPPNTTFTPLDIFDPIPLHLISKYDLLCLRHFICVIQSGNPTRLLKQLLRMLKPGGWLQWQEWDISTNCLLSAEGAVAKAPKLKAYMDLTQGVTALQEQTAWVKTFHTHPLLASSSPEAELIVHDRHWTAKEVFLLKQEIAFLGAREWSENLRGRGEVREAERIERVAREAEAECWEQGRGTVVDGEMVTWVLRKKGGE